MIATSPQRAPLTSAAADVQVAPSGLPLSGRLMGLLHALLAGCYLVLGLWQIRLSGPTTDEFPHVAGAVSYLHGLGLAGEHPLGQKALVSATLALTTPRALAVAPTDSMWTFGWKLMVSDVEYDEGLLFWSRLTILVTNALPLLFLWAYSSWLRWLSPLFGVALAALYVFSPPIFAHAGLVTFDVGGSAAALMATLLSAAFIWKLPSLTTRQVVAHAGVVVAAYTWAAITKYSNAALAPALGLTAVAGVVALWPSRDRLLAYLASWVASAVACAGVVLGLYTWAFRHAGPVPLETFRHDLGQGIPLCQWLASLEGTPLGFLSPLKWFLWGLLSSLDRSLDTIPAFAFGQERLMSLGTYFWQVLPFKENLAFLPLAAMAVVGLVVAAGRAPRRPAALAPTRARPWFRTARGWLALLILAFFPLYYALRAHESHLVLGYRHAYPLLVFVYALVAFGLCQTAAVFGRWGPRALGVGLLAYCLCGLAAVPQGISYVSPLHRGPKWTFAGDSTVNWGQEQLNLYRAVGAVLAERPDLMVATEHWPFLPPPPGLMFLATGQRFPQLNHGKTGPLWETPLESAPFDLIAVDTYFFQRAASSRHPVAARNLALLSALEPVYTSRDVVFIYQLKPLPPPPPAP